MNDLGLVISIAALWALAMYAVLAKPSNDHELERLARINKRVAEELERTKRGNR